MEHLLEILDLKKKTEEEDQDKFYSFETFLLILKYFVLNQKEKDYLDRILEEVEQNERLDKEVE